nr:transposase [Streptomyces sp. AC558_RSS880]
MPRSYPPEFRRRVLDLVASGRKVAEAAQLLGVSDQTIYNWRRRHLIDTGQIPGTTSSDQAEPAAARKRITELALGLGIHVHHGTVELLMQRAGLHGLPGNRARRRPRPQTPSAADPVERNFTRHARNQLWVTDITEHPTTEGKVYCAVVLDAFAGEAVASPAPVFTVPTRPVDQPGGLARPVAAQRGDRVAAPGPAAHPHHRRVSAPAPGAGLRRGHAEPRLVLEDEEGPERRRGHSACGRTSFFHSSTACSSRSRTRRAGDCQDQPCRCIR